MLTKFMTHWNPLNLYGTEVEVEDLICNPLKSNETLRQDCRGHCRRIQAPSLHSSLWKRFVFWVQVHLNKKGHLEAINNIISLFSETLLQHPPLIIKDLENFNLQADKLRSLQNDYGFIYLKQGNPAFVESRLDEIKQHAYSIFAAYHGQQALAEEEARKKDFMLFQEDIERKLEELDVQYIEGLYKARLLLVVSSHCLDSLFEERVQSLQRRFKIIQEIEQQIDEMEMMHKGKFTIPCINDYFSILRLKVCIEVRKIGIEAESVIENLMLNYRIGPFKEEIRLLLYSIEIDPENSSTDEMSAPLFCEALKDEIERIHKIFKTLL